MDLTAGDVWRIAGERNVARVVQSGSIVPSVLRSGQRGAAGHRFALWPDVPLFALRRQLSDLGFGESTIRPVLRAVADFDGQALLSIRLLVWAPPEPSPKISARFIDTRVPDNARARREIRRDSRVIFDGDLRELLAAVVEQLRATTTPEEWTKLTAECREWLQRLEERKRKRAARPRGRRS